MKIIANTLDKIFGIAMAGLTLTTTVVIVAPIFTAGNHVTANVSIYTKMSTNDVISFVFFSNNFKIRMLIFMPPSAVHGQPYLEELEPYFVAFHLTSVSNTSKFYLKYAATLHT